MPKITFLPVMPPVRGRRIGFMNRIIKPLESVAMHARPHSFCGSQVVARVMPGKQLLSKPFWCLCVILVMLSCKDSSDDSTVESRESRPIVGAISKLAIRNSDHQIVSSISLLVDGSKDPTQIESFIYFTAYTNDRTGQDFTAVSGGMNINGVWGAGTIWEHATYPYSFSFNISYVQIDFDQALLKFHEACPESQTAKIILTTLTDPNGITAPYYVMNSVGADVVYVYVNAESGTATKYDANGSVLLNGNG